MSQEKPVRSIARTFDVLDAVAMSSGASLHEIELRTGLPRPTVARLAKTLEERHLLRRGIRDGRYHLGRTLAELALRLEPDSLLADVAAPGLNALSRETGWPAAVALYEPDPGDCMRLVETSRKISRFYLRAVTITRINLLLSSLGLAYLAYTTPEQLDAVLARVRQVTRDPHNLAAIAAGGLHERLAELRTLGYAPRDPRFLGGGYNELPVDDRITGIGVPLLWEGQAFGSLNVYWHRRAMSVEDAAAAYLPLIRDTASRIAAEAARLGVAQRLLDRQAVQAHSS